MIPISHFEGQKTAEALREVYSKCQQKKQQQQQQQQPSKNVYVCVFAGLYRRVNIELTLIETEAIQTSFTELCAHIHTRIHYRGQQKARSVLL